MTDADESYVSASLQYFRLPDQRRWNVVADAAYGLTDRWRVYDVLIEGVSLVGNYRTQFNRVIQQSGYDDLLKKMKTKQEELAFEDEQRPKPKP